MVAMLVKHALGLDQNVTGDKDVETEMTSVLKCPKLSMDSRRCFWNLWPKSPITRNMKANDASRRK